MAHYQAQYSALTPEEITARTGLPFSPERGQFTLTALGLPLYAAWPEFSLHAGEPERTPAALLGFGAQLLVLRYLIEGRAEPFSGGFLSYREIPWGETYEKQFHGRCILRFAFSFGPRPEDFKRGASALGGAARTLGDASYDLPFFGGIVIRMIVWAADEEFPPSAQILFSDNTPAAFTAEDLAAVGDVVISALKEAAGK